MMLRRTAFFAAAALAAGGAPLTFRLGAVPGSLLLVAAAVALAAAASGAVASLAVAGGALGALAFGVLAGVSPAAAGAALAGLCFAERSARVRSGKARLAHAGLALAGGALAVSVTAAFAASSLVIRGVAVVVAAVLMALPLLIEADDPLAHALDGAAEEITGPARASLRDGAALRRTVVEEEMPDRKATRHARETWASLMRLARARVRLERAAGARRAAPEGPGEVGGGEVGGGEPPPAKTGAAASPVEVVIGRVDARIADHVAALTRAYAAADAARAAATSLDDTALRRVETMGESLEQVSKAIVEEV
ncbi:uncharacterized protein SOCE26_014130 [Sorangium cellulosum]|uniref:Uncharacterized protein n=1 Tax=Sorangium cellulosum TaxID=56 RepID=A0A2L0EL52_SORCE|nr:hypothetical protein [Sorangium cellulosum]AUX40018.1 uncharacterized protein SOCE26_014130 [Sorangium cellulosum]